MRAILMGHSLKRCCRETLQQRAPTDPKPGDALYCRFSLCLERLEYVGGIWQNTDELKYRALNEDLRKAATVREAELPTILGRKD